MFKSTKTKIIALALVGVVALGGAVYATTALAAGRATAAPATSVTVQTAVDPQLRANILEMLKSRMGLTGANAEQFADQMIARMQAANGGYCNPGGAISQAGGQTNGSSYGRGMMGGYGYGMMGSSGLR